MLSQGLTFFPIWGLSAYPGTLSIQGAIQAYPIHVIFYAFSPCLPDPTRTSYPATTTFLQWMNEWTDTSLWYRHWRMCFERLLQAFARWQPGNLFDIAAQPILEYHWTDSYTQLSLRTQFKVATVYSIHTQSLSWCSTGLVPSVLPRRDEGSGKPCAVDRAS